MYLLYFALAFVLCLVQEVYRLGQEGCRLDWEEFGLKAEIVLCIIKGMETAQNIAFVPVTDGLYHLYFKN